MRRIPFKHADEYDCLTSWRKYYVYLQRPGATDRIKRRYRRRERRLGKKEIRDATA
jgi:hypothetical protein